jgi:hypothetical protein
LANIDCIQELIAFAIDMDWASPDPSVYGQELEAELETNKDEVTDYLCWPFKLGEHGDLSLFSSKFMIERDQ